MFNGHENFEKNKDVGGLFLFLLGVGTVCSLHFNYSYFSSLCCSVVVSIGVPWTMARSILYFKVLGTYLCRRDAFPEYSPSSLVYCVHNRSLQCANFYPEYSIVGSCAQYFLREALSFQRNDYYVTECIYCQWIANFLVRTNLRDLIGISVAL